MDVDINRRNSPELALTTAFETSRQAMLSAWLQLVNAGAADPSDIGATNEAMTQMYRIGGPLNGQ